MNVKTIGELKKLIKGMDNNLPIISPSSNFETGNALQLGAYIEVIPMSERKKRCRDNFDNTSYTITEFVQDEKEGKNALVIR